MYGVCRQDDRDEADAGDNGDEEHGVDGGTVKPNKMRWQEGCQWVQLLDVWERLGKVLVNVL